MEQERRILEKLEQEENDLCVEINLKICKLADESGYGRDYYMNRILEKLQAVMLKPDGTPLMKEDIMQERTQNE